MKTIALATLAALLPAFPAAAQNTVPVTQYRQSVEADPNKLICESEEQIGSRLAKHRVCLTAEQWKEKHREHGSSAAEPGREFEADAPLLTSYPDRCR